MSTFIDQDNSTVNSFKLMLSSYDRPVFIVVTCLMCDSCIGISNEVNVGKEKISLRGCSVKIGVTVCYGCGVRSRFGRVYSAVDINRFIGKTIVQRLHEEAARHDCSIDYISSMVYLKPVVVQLSFKMFSVVPGACKGSGLRLGDAVHTDMIRS